jgi:hypothetical protein
MSGEIVARGDHCNLFATASKLHRRCVYMFSRYPFRSHPINWVPTCSWAVDEAVLMRMRCEVQFPTSRSVRFSSKWGERSALGKSSITFQEVTENFFFASERKSEAHRLLARCHMSNVTTLLRARETTSWKRERRIGAVCRWNCRRRSETWWPFKSKLLASCQVQHSTSYIFRPHPATSIGLLASATIHPVQKQRIATQQPPRWLATHSPRSRSTPTWARHLVDGHWGPMRCSCPC